MTDVIIKAEGMERKFRGIETIIFNRFGKGRLDFFQEKNHYIGDFPIDFIDKIILK